MIWQGIVNNGIQAYRVFTIRDLAFYSVIFLLLHFEPISLFGAFKFSHVWKGGIEFFCLCTIVLKFKKSPPVPIQLPRTICWGYLLALWPLIVAPLSHSPTSEIFIAGQRLFPVLIFHILFLSLFNEHELLKMLKQFSVFVALSALPFLFEIVDPIGKQYDISIFSYVAGSSYIGIFQNPHSASLASCLAGLIAFFFYLESRGRSKFIWMGFVLLLMYLTFATYVRTGVASFLAAVVFFALRTKNLKKTIGEVVLVSTFIILLAMNFHFLPGIKSRLVGQTLRTSGHERTLDEISSGRLTLWNASLEIYSESGAKEFLFGHGQTGALDAMKQKIGLRLFPHNGFLEELLVHGPVGLALFMMYLVGIARDIRRIENYKIRNLGYSMLLGVIVFNMFQGTNAPIHALFFIPFVLLYGYANSGGGTEGLESKYL